MVFWDPQHVLGEGTLTWSSRVASRYVHRDVRTADGTELSIWAFPRGIRPASTWSVSFAPWPVWATRIVFENLRYRTKYRSAWVVEIRNPQSDLPLDDRVLPSRRAAMDTVEQTRVRLSGLPLDHVGRALGT